MNTQSLIGYCTAIFIASIIPGPSMLLALTQGSKFGVVAGSFTAIGNVAASIMQGIIALVIIIHVGQLSPTMLFSIKIVGAIYIIYLGTTLLGVSDFGEPKKEDFEREKAGVIRCVWDGFAFAIFNPKALTFFAALFPQFVQGGEITAHTVAIIFVPITTIAFICFMIYVVAGNALFRMFGYSKHIGKFLGGGIIFAGISLVFS